MVLSKTIAQRDHVVDTTDWEKSDSLNGNKQSQTSVDTRRHSGVEVDFLNSSREDL